MKVKTKNLEEEKLYGPRLRSLELTRMVIGKVVWEKVVAIMSDTISSWNLSS